MSALSPLSLAAACRAIYVQAADGAILPPLIRDAADREPPRRTIEICGDGFAVSFGVVYAEPGRDPSGRRGHPPLRFEIEAEAGGAVDLTAEERFALIRAFLLGVREPAAIEAPAGGADWRVGFKISSRFAIWAAEPVRLDVGLSADQIAERLAARLTENTGRLFATPEIGRAVWKLRLQQELFAERRPQAHEIWQDERPADGAAPGRASLALPAPLAAVRVPRCARAVSLRAIAAAAALVGFAALAGAIASHGADGDATVGARTIEVSDIGAAWRPDREAAAQPSPVPPAAPIRPADAVFHPAAMPQGAGEARFARLAPDVTEAARTMSLSAFSPVVWSPAPTRLAALPAVSALSKDARTPPPRPAFDLRRPTAQAVADKAVARPIRANSPLVQVNRSVRKFVRSIARRLPHMKFTALNSPNAAGPRTP